jgi:putative ABC transport system permease protein
MGENIRIALDAILINKARAILTMLGIIIGISSVIALISLGRGVENFIFSEFELLGAKRLSVSSSPPVADTRNRIDPLTMEDVENLRNPAIGPNIEAVGARYDAVVQVEYLGEQVVTTARGMTSNMSELLSWDVQLGSFFTDAQDFNKEKVVVLGLDVVDDLFGSEDANPLGAQIRLDNQVFTVIGVLEERGSAFGNDNSAVVVPISVAQTRLSRARVGNDMTVSTLYVDSVSNDAIDQTEAEIDAYLYQKHLLNSVEERDYTINNPSTIQDAVRGITGLLTILLAVIASISLFVGGIGIMNIMLVTVTERTREIGLRKAVGATPDRILGQFLIESIILSMVGGAIGIFFGWLIAFLGSAAIDGLNLTVELDAILIATTVSTGVGVIFGILPARQAANMNPIDALRYE